MIFQWHNMPELFWRLFLSKLHDVFLSWFPFPPHTFIISCKAKTNKESKRRNTMSEKAIENNKVTVIGKVVSGFTFSHEV